MDRIQHFLWRYCNRNDPTYPGPTPYDKSIKKFYVFIDEIIGKFVGALGPDDQLIVISDHGHGMRCTHCFNINEFLRKHGYVQSVAEGKLISKELILEKLKSGVLAFMDKHNLEDYVSKIARFIPNAGKIKKGKHITKTLYNKAYASDFTGTNPFGGVCINTDLVDDYDLTRGELINLLSYVKENGKPVFKWLKKREEMFNGEFLERFPDILFCLNYNYGVNWNLHTNEFTINPTHKKISGGHKEDGVFFTNISAEKLTDDKDLKITNFFSTVLYFFRIDAKQLSRGKSFIKIA